MCICWLHLTTPLTELDMHAPLWSIGSSVAPCSQPTAHPLCLTCIARARARGNARCVVLGPAPAHNVQLRTGEGGALTASDLCAASAVAKDAALMHPLGEPTALELWGRRFVVTKCERGHVCATSKDQVGRTHFLTTLVDFARLQQDRNIVRYH